MIHRYQTKEIGLLFTDEYKIKKWILVEKIVAEVEEQANIIPQGLSRKLANIKIKPERIYEIERVTNHDVIAFLHAVREKLGKEGQWLHFGLTSYDLVDTAFVLIITEGMEVIFREIRELLKVVKRLSLRYKNTPQMGRTHGMFAQPITFGYKVASWYMEITRAYKRLISARSEIAYGKLSGAVGSYTMLAPVIERKVMKKLKLKPEPVSTQVLPRDRFAFLVSTLVLYVCALERIATEIRNLSRTEIGELAEPFTKGQKGSSAMPHKKNPIICERICGLARIARSYLGVVYENINLWHERDITNSSAERIILPDIFHLVHYVSKKTLWVLKNLNVYPHRMRENIEKSYGVYASQRLMNVLIEHGMERIKAYKRIQQLCFTAVKEEKNLRDVVSEDRMIRKYLVQREIDKIFDLKWFLRNMRITK
jgi:adenylosuccinate lyase